MSFAQHYQIHTHTHFWDVYLQFSNVRNDLSNKNNGTTNLQIYLSY